MVDVCVVVFFPDVSCRFSLLPALSLNGILFAEVLDRSFTGATFLNFIDGVLNQMNPWPQKNSVLVMDNASIHHLNPIEEAFSSIKAWIRANRDYVQNELSNHPTANPYCMLYEAIYTVTAEKTRGWFKHSHYNV
ncbi:hypothetical protein JAAARDRAFT_123582 [Jaapia argillacea MUCL 33604]|uniref:Uncharacterized protein n=1 Tax=Jaapia argillacea MUCL 33604 TaxID=933084 RepID=A0A067Q4D3_9AGAM|nr:hypothetical protein JAAARDRAFT_123582 [Jaapia argillacea MUCL 33604]